jgi:hypothetical protein
MNKKIFLSLAMLSLATIFCTSQIAGQTTASPDINAMVNATLTEMVITAQPVISSFTPASTPSEIPISNIPTGMIIGTLSYPAETLPSERVVAWNTADRTYFSVDNAAGQSDYRLKVPAGTYHVVAYVIGGAGLPSGLAGGYTNMVPCGLSADCTDHTLIPVEVKAGDTIENINPGDWYAEASAFPVMP